VTRWIRDIGSLNVIVGLPATGGCLSVSKLFVETALGEAHPERKNATKKTRANDEITRLQLRRSLFPGHVPAPIARIQNE